MGQFLGDDWVAIRLGGSCLMRWYDNFGLETQLRLGNASASTAAVHVYMHGVEMPGSPFTLPAGGSTRVAFAGVNAGPVKIQSEQLIVAVERLMYAPYVSLTSFAEMMGLPNLRLDTPCWMPR